MRLRRPGGRQVPASCSSALRICPRLLAYRGVTPISWLNLRTATGNGAQGMLAPGRKNQLRLLGEVMMFRRNL
jgi:hypothetical protein